MENKLDIPFEIKQINEREGKGLFEGYASVFNIKDCVQDIVLKGAFNNTIQKKKLSNEKKLPMLWSHEQNNPVGFFDIDEMIEDEVGLFVKGEILLDIPQGRIAYNLLKNGICKEMSIGYIPTKKYYDEEKKARVISELDLYEISLVMFPANQKAKILNVKSMNFDNIKVSSIETVLDKKSAQDRVAQFSESNNVNVNDFYFLTFGDEKKELFVDIVDNVPEINIKSVLDFARKSNIESLNLKVEERKELESKINNIFRLIREKTNDLSFISPFEVQQGVINNFTIKDCERFLKKAGLTNAGFKSFFERLLELKGCGSSKKPRRQKKEEENTQQENNSLEENGKETPGELDDLKTKLQTLQNLLKNF